jgi:hypothetical protein
MKLSNKERLEIEALAKQAALRHYQANNADATENDAWKFAVRYWRSPAFLTVGVEVIAVARAYREKLAASMN